jgi:hypothetical protein
MMARGGLGGNELRNNRIPLGGWLDGNELRHNCLETNYDITTGGAVVGLVLALEFFLSLIGSWSAGVYSYSTQINRILGISAILALIAGGLSLASAILIHRLGEKKPGVLNLASYLASGSVFSTGALLFIAGMVELINKDEPGMHFQKLGSNGAVTGDTAYAIMSIVVGAIVVGVAVFMVISTFQESHKEKPVVKK